MLRLSFPLLLLSAVARAAAADPVPASAPPLDPLLQLMITQPSIEVTTNTEVSASFDPPVVRPGEKAIYRITFNALEDSIRWPQGIRAPEELSMRLSARGQMFWPVANQLRPQTTVNYHVRAAGIGSFTIPEFEIEVYGRPVIVPAARLDVVPHRATGIASPQQLQVEVLETNIHAGQPVTVRVLLHGSVSNSIQMLTQVRLNGDGFLMDQGLGRQSITTQLHEGHMVPTYAYETTLTPLMSGPLAFSAQGFTAGNRMSGMLVIQGRAVIPGGPPQYILLDSDPVILQVRPLPRTGELPGFTGAIGQFVMDPPQLSADSVRAGDLLKLAVIIRGSGNLSRLVPPPPPRPADWQVFAADVGRGGQVTPLPQSTAGPSVSFVFSMIPLTNGTMETPAIPFCYFDPEQGTYVDLTIPSVPLEVTPGPVAVGFSGHSGDSASAPVKKDQLALSGLATAPGRSASLEPMQRQPWFIAVQAAPVAGLLGLWAWDRRRRYFEHHPDLVLKRRARRALRRQRRTLERALRAKDARQYGAAAVRAMRIACAPHYPAEPNALVCRDIIELLGANGHHDPAHDTVRHFFAVADAQEFSDQPADLDGLLAHRKALDRVLQDLEARL